KTQEVQWIVLGVSQHSRSGYDTREDGLKSSDEVSSHMLNASSNYMLLICAKQRGTPFDLIEFVVPSVGTEKFIKTHPPLLRNLARSGCKPHEPDSQWEQQPKIDRTSRRHRFESRPLHLHAVRV